MLKRIFTMDLPYERAYGLRLGRWNFLALCSKGREYRDMRNGELFEGEWAFGWKVLGTGGR